MTDVFLIPLIIFNYADFKKKLEGCTINYVMAFFAQKLPSNFFID